MRKLVPTLVATLATTLLAAPAAHAYLALPPNTPLPLTHGDPPQVGQPMTVQIDPAQWEPGAKFSYDWWACRDTDGYFCTDDFGGSGAATYTPTDEVAGRSIQVKVTVTTSDNQLIGEYASEHSRVIAPTDTVGTPGTYQQAVLGSGPVALWSFEQVGTTYLNSVAGGPSFTGGDMRTVAGASHDGSRALKSSRSGVLGPTASGATLQSPQFSFEFWFKHTPDLAQDKRRGRYLFTKRDAANKPLFKMSVTETVGDATPNVWSFGQIGLSANADGDTFLEWAQSWSTHSVPNRWIHIVYTVNGTSTFIWTDGVMRKQVSTTTLANTKAGTWRIGDIDNAGVPNGFEGFFDDFAIYDRALTATEIRAHYAARTAQP